MTGNKEKTDDVHAFAHTIPCLLKMFEQRLAREIKRALKLPRLPAVTVDVQQRELSATVYITGTPGSMLDTRLYVPHTAMTSTVAVIDHITDAIGAEQLQGLQRALRGGE